MASHLALRERAALFVVGATAWATWVAGPLLGLDRPLEETWPWGVPGLVLWAVVLARPTPVASLVGFPLALALPSHVLGETSGGWIVAWLATLAAWLVVSSAALREGVMTSGSEVVGGRDWVPISGPARTTRSFGRAALAGVLVFGPSLAPWIDANLVTRAQLSFPGLGGLAVVGATLLAVLVGLALASDLLKGRSPRQGRRRRAVALAFVSLAFFGVVGALRGWA
jgi:hypothetical protein